MHVSTRSYLTAGIAALSVGAMSFAPIQPLSHAPATSPELTKAAVQLASSIDPITPWINILQTTGANLTGLIDTYSNFPLPILQTALNNVGTYVSEIPNFSLILSQIGANIINGTKAPFSADIDTLDEAHASIYALLPQVADVPQGLLDWTTSPSSGLLMSFIGPVLAPVVALGDSFRSIFASLSGSDFIGALNTLINIPAAMVNAFLNGGPNLNVDGVIGPLLPAGSTLRSANIVLGGLFSQGASLLNAFALDADVKAFPNPVPAIPIVFPGTPAGILGTAIAWNNAVAQAITVTPPNVQSSRVAASAVAAAAEEEVSAQVEVTVDAVDAIGPVLYSAAPSGDKAPAAPKQGSHRASRSSADAKSAASAHTVSKARAATSRGK